MFQTSFTDAFARVSNVRVAHITKKEPSSKVFFIMSVPRNQSEISQYCVVIGLNSKGLVILAPAGLVRFLDSQ